MRREMGELCERSVQILSTYPQSCRWTLPEFLRGRTTLPICACVRVRRAKFGGFLVTFRCMPACLLWGRGGGVEPVLRLLPRNETTYHTFECLDSIRPCAATAAMGGGRCT